MWRRWDSWLGLISSRTTSGPPQVSSTQHCSAARWYWQRLGPGLRLWSWLEWWKCRVPTCSGTSFVTSSLIDDVIMDVGCWCGTMWNGSMERHHRLESDDVIITHYPARLTWLTSDLSDDVTTKHCSKRPNIESFWWWRHQSRTTGHVISTYFIISQSQLTTWWRHR